MERDSRNARRIEERYLSPTENILYRFVAAIMGREGLGHMSIMPLGIQEVIGGGFYGNRFQYRLTYETPDVQAIFLGLVGEASELVSADLFAVRIDNPELQPAVERVREAARQMKDGTFVPRIPNEQPM